MQLPKVSNNDFQERAGVFTVAALISQIGLIFRETSNTDVGIDGQVEYVSGNKAIGKVIAVQIKSGTSYLKDKGDHFAFYPEEKHRNYWELFPLPVVVMLHDPETQYVYFADIKYYLAIPERERKYRYIPVLKSNILSESSKQDLFSLSGIADGEFLSFPELLNTLVNTVHDDGSFPVSYFDLFVNSLTNLCRHSFFTMQIALDIAEYNLSYLNSALGIGVNDQTQEFLHNYVRVLISQNLVQINYSDYLIDWKERQMQSNFLAPLTARGRALVEYIREIESKFFSKEENKVSVACSRFVEMAFAPSDAYRLKKIYNFSKRYNESA